MTDLKCRVPMWMNGLPSGHCGEKAYGDQLPFEVLQATRSRYQRRADVPYCHGPCCPNHGGPKHDEIRVYQDGYSSDGRQMWCAVNSDFVNLQESDAEFDDNPLAARNRLLARNKKMPS